MHLFIKKRVMFSSFAYCSCAVLIFCYYFHSITLQRLLTRKEKYILGSHSNLQFQQQVWRRTKSWRGFETLEYAEYKGPWIEEYVIDFWVGHFYPTGRIYLPISWTNCHVRCTADEKNSLRAFIANLTTAYTYFTVLQIDRGFQHPALDITVPANLDIIIFCSGGFTQGEKVINIPIPLLKKIIPFENEAKEINVSFVGSLTHPVREELYSLYSNDFKFLKPAPDWVQTMKKSTFSLCPRGYGSTSFRLFEAIQVGSIPVYIWDEELMLPFADHIDWNSFSIVINRKDISTLKERIAEANIRNLQHNLNKLSHIFNYEYTSEYILNYINVQ